MIDLEQIKNLLRQDKPLEEIIEKFNWKNFEKIVSEIFEENSFRVIKNFKFKTRKRYEIDILAIKRDIVLCVDCKEWSKGRHKKTGLKYAVKKQQKRLKELISFLKNNLIARNLLKINVNYKFYPVIVTLFQEELVKEDKTFIVPIWKLNSFLLDTEKLL